MQMEEAMKANIAHYKSLGDKVAEQNCRNFLKLYQKNLQKKQNNG